MSATNQSWSRFGEKLANLDHVPGEPLPNTENLWNRLQQRAQQGRKRRRMYRCGIAASFTILFSLLLSLSANKNIESPQAGNTPATAIPFTSEKAITSTPAPGTPLVEPAIPKKVTVQKGKKKNQQVFPGPVALPVVTAAPEMMVRIAVPEIIEPLMPVIATSSPAKIRRPMIHVRDLNAYRGNNAGSPVNEMRRVLIKKSAADVANLSAQTEQQGYILKKNNHTN